MTDQGRPVCAIIGAGPGIGEAFARRFAADGFAVALLARNVGRIEALAKEIPGARAFACDAGEAASIEQAFTAIEAQMGPVATLLYNAGKGVWGDFQNVSPSDFEEAWKANTLGLLLAAQRAAPAMIASGCGAIIVTGATASLRGAAQTAAFAPAKAAQRALAQSLAKSLWPKGVHVALIIIDGVVDSPANRAGFAGKGPEFFVEPAAVADTAASLVGQRRSAWSFEVEARPFGERW